MPDKSKTLYELAAKAVGGDPASNGTITFDDEGIELHDAGYIFLNGNYTASKDLFKGMEILGKQVLDQAKKEGINITDLPECKNIDFDKNGTISAKEVGAFLLACSMDTYKGDYVNPKAKCESLFDDGLTREDTEKLLDPKAAGMIKLIAMQLLQDNGVRIPHGQTNEQFIQAIDKLNLPKRTFGIK